MEQESQESPCPEINMSDFVVVEPYSAVKEVEMKMENGISEVGRQASDITQGL